MRRAVTRRDVLAGSAAAALAAGLPARPANAAFMTPATAEVHFEHEAADTVLRFSFIELLWRQTEDGEVKCHLEMDTKQFTDSNGVTYGRPGFFSKGGASGPFYVAFGPDLPRTRRQFWWPPDARPKQPPAKAGQNMWGKVWWSVGVRPETFPSGYTEILPSAGNGQVRFLLAGIGKDRIPLTADHFIENGDVKLYADFSFMIGQ